MPEKLCACIRFYFFLLEETKQNEMTSTRGENVGKEVDPQHAIFGLPKL
jgi:hypothetical protein